MAATRQDISRWFDEGVAKKATHMVVACDTYDWDDYPVYVHAGTDPKSVFNASNGQNMTKAMECYALWKLKAPQMQPHRTIDFEQPPATPQPTVQHHGNESTLP